MIVFKTFWKVVKQYKGTILLYTILLVVFGGLNMSTSEQGMNFVASKPDVLIVNEDIDEGLTANLVHYFEENANIVKIDMREEAIHDALFYRDVNYVIYIPKNYRENVLRGENPEIRVKKTPDYQATFAEMMLSRYVQVQNIYAKNTSKEEDLIANINRSLGKKAKIEVTSKLDTNWLGNMTQYFNFASYSMMAVVIFVICLVLSSFHEEMIMKRTKISSMNYRKYNGQLLMASLLYGFVVWGLFVVLGGFLLGRGILEVRGLVYIFNLLLFTFCSLTIALLISTLVHNKNAISGIVNVVALGSAFLCGAFVPVEWLPNQVLKIAHLLPAYWYIQSNELLKNMEVMNLSNLKPVFINMGVIVIFGIFFIGINNIVTRKKQKG